MILTDYSVVSLIFLICCLEVNVLGVRRYVRWPIADLRCPGYNELYTDCYAECDTYCEDLFNIRKRMDCKPPPPPSAAADDKVSEEKKDDDAGGEGGEGGEGGDAGGGEEGGDGEEGEGEGRQEEEDAEGEEGGEEKDDEGGDDDKGEDGESGDDSKGSKDSEDDSGEKCRAGCICSTGTSRNRDGICVPNDICDSDEVLAGYWALKANSHYSMNDLESPKEQQDRTGHDSHRINEPIGCDQFTKKPWECIRHAPPRIRLNELDVEEQSEEKYKPF